jgi:hypothetical protein
MNACDSPGSQQALVFAVSSYILSTFPIVPEATKQAALEAYKTFTL